MRATGKQCRLLNLASSTNIFELVRGNYVIIVEHPMTFETWFTVEATDEAAQMSRGWSYWPLFVFKNLYGIGLMLVLFFGGGAGVIRNLSKPEPDFQKAGLSLLLCILPVAVFWWLRNRDLRKANELLATMNPLNLTFDSSGITTLEKTGKSNFTPWSGFDGYREGRLVLLLRDKESKQYRIISKKTLPEADAEGLRSAIRSRLPEIGSS